MEKEREETLATILELFTSGDENTIAVLQKIQDAFGYVPEEAINWLSSKINVPTSKFYGIITFYSQFHLKPRGKNIVTACCGTVCHVKGANRIISRLRDELALKGDQETTKDGLFTLENVNCVGACSIAPIVVINDKVHGKMTPDKAVKHLKTCEK